MNLYTFFIIHVFNISDEADDLVEDAFEDLRD